MFLHLSNTENLYSDSESYPCAQQKLLIPVDLQQYKIPAVLVPSINFFTLSKTDLLWRNGLISMEDRNGMATFLDNDTSLSPLFFKGFPYRSC